jgi:hypothetical protein
MGKTLDNEVDGFPHSELHGFIQIFMQPHHHPMSGRFPSGPLQLHVLANEELKASLNSMAIPG